MTYRIDAIPAFNDNYVWCISDREQDKALVVDPGDAAPVSAFLESRGLTLDMILLTHHHPDHSHGIKTLLREAKVPVHGPTNSPYKGVTHELREGDSFKWRDWQFNVLEVPGHTLDHIAFIAENTPLDVPVAFCGDALFACGCGRLFEGTPAQMRQSLAKLRDLPERTELYCGHEYTLANVAFSLAVTPDNKELQSYESECKRLRENDRPTLPTVLGRELRINPFLRWDSEDVEQAAEAYGQKAALDVSRENPDQVFAAIRHWKDNF